MPYMSVEIDPPQAHFEDELDGWEKDGWTLVQVVPGFSTYDEDNQQQVFWKPRFILHRPEEKKRSGAVHFT